MSQIRDINPEWTDTTLVSLIDAWASINPGAGGALLSHLADIAASEEDIEESDESLLQGTDDGDECPLCENGTVEHRDGWVECCGECGAVAECKKGAGTA